MANPKILDSTKQEFVMLSGKKVLMTLSFRRLLQLKTTNKAQYSRYNAIMMNGPEDMFDNVTILYTAYLCALEENEAAMTYDEFIDDLPPFMNEINEMVQSLIRPKKKEPSEQPS